MDRIDTLEQAIGLIHHWTSWFPEQPTEEQVLRAALLLIYHVGGLGGAITPQVVQTFDLDLALNG